MLSEGSNFIEITEKVFKFQGLCVHKLRRGKEMKEIMCEKYCITQKIL